MRGRAGHKTHLDVLGCHLLLREALGAVAGQLVDGEAVPAV
jgi:hypothetical protein